MGFEAMVYDISLIDVGENTVLLKMDCEHARGGTRHVEYRLLNLSGKILGSYSTENSYESVTAVLSELIK